MVRQLPPPHLKPVPPSTPSYRFPSDLVVNHYVGDRLIPAIPGFRTSAAFLTSLSANLRLGDDEPMPSPMSTPPSMRGSTSSLPLPPPSPLAVSQTNALSAVDSAAGLSSDNPSHSSVTYGSEPLPPLSTYGAVDEDDRVDGLKLVADSVAQQRQLASRMLIFHPLHMAVWIGFLAVVGQMTYKSKDDILFLVTTFAGITMAFLIAVRWATGGYLFLAEEIGWSWLGDDTLIVSKWGDEIIGALVLGWSDENTAKKKAGRGKRRGKALVRAWTVKLRYRRKGVGEALLEEAVRIAGEKGVEGIEFAEDHATAKRVLPNLYNSFLDKRDMKAEEALEKVSTEKGHFGKRR